MHPTPVRAKTALRPTGLQRAIQSEPCLVGRGKRFLPIVMELGRPGSARRREVAAPVHAAAGSFGPTWREYRLTLKVPGVHVQIIPRPRRIAAWKPVSVERCLD